MRGVRGLGLPTPYPGSQWITSTTGGGDMRGIYVPPGMVLTGPVTLIYQSTGPVTFRINGIVVGTCFSATGCSGVTVVINSGLLKTGNNSFNIDFGYGYHPPTFIDFTLFVDGCIPLPTYENTEVIPPSSSPTGNGTSTPIASYTPTVTATWSVTDTSTATGTVTDTPTITGTPTVTFTPTNTIACCPQMVGDFPTGGTGIYGIAVDTAHGWVYVADNGTTNQILKFNTSGTQLTTPSWLFSSSTSVKNVAIGPAPNYWVYALDAHGFSAFDPNTGELKLDYHNNGTGALQFYGAKGIAVDNSGNVFVCDQNLFKILEFDASAPAPNFIQQISSYGNTDGYLSSPDGIALYYSNGIEYLLVVSGSQQNNIQKFRIDGASYTSMGEAVPHTYCSGDGAYSQTLGVAIDSNGYIYDSGLGGSGGLNKFNPDGSCLCIGFPGVTDYVAVDSDNYVYVTNPVTQHIMKFQSVGCP
jgi:hypothetical protein